MVMRLLPERDNHDGPANARQWAEWLDSLENERDVLIMRLRHVDRVLVKHGRLRVETLVRRER